MAKLISARPGPRPPGPRRGMRPPTRLAAPLLAVVGLGAGLAYFVGLAADLPALRLAAKPFPALALAAWVLAVVGPGLGGLAVPVAVYVAVVCAMMWRAAARVGGTGRAAAAAWLGLAGAVAFGASDTLIALDRFAAPLPGVRWPIMLLYWLGQWGIAASAVCSRPR